MEEREPFRGRRLFAIAFLAVVELVATRVSAAAATGVTITAGGCSGGGSLYCYNPEASSASTGSSVTWTNMSAGVAHTVTLCDSANCPGAPASTGSDGFDLSVSAANGSTASFSFSHAGTYYYYCRIHGYANMHGSITVTAQASPSPTASGAASAPQSGVSGTTVPGTGFGAPAVLPFAVLTAAGIAAVASAIRRRPRQR